MKCRLKSDGVLRIVGETEAEDYALRKWPDDNDARLVVVYTQKNPSDQRERTFTIEEVGNGR